MAESERTICLGDDLASIPEKLLLAHGQGRVLFVVGAGISKAAGLPTFKELVLEVYKSLDPSIYNLMKNYETQVIDQLNYAQKAEISRYIFREYDSVLGMLERRMGKDEVSRVRETVVQIIRDQAKKPNEIHRSLMNLADRGGVRAIITTNFDLLLEEAARRLNASVQTYSIGEIPRPSRDHMFSGVMHIHGAISKNSKKVSNLILTDYDFGSYLRRGVVSDFIYDASRLFDLVLVGYSLNDPPMRYLMNEIASDGYRFSDIKDRYIFVGTSDRIELEGWKNRGIIPISYEKNNGHEALRNTLARWANISVISGNKRIINAQIKKIVRHSRANCSQRDRDLFDHLFRRASKEERNDISTLVSQQNASLDWLDGITNIIMERRHQIQNEDT